MISFIAQNQTEISDHKIKKRSQYFKIIDNNLMEMNPRLKQIELIEAVEASKLQKVLRLKHVLKIARNFYTHHFLEKFRI